MASRPNGEDIAVQLDRVTKRFGKTTALDELNLLVRRGELMTLLGPSGCGKTTLLRMVAGLEKPDQGNIRIGGEPVVGPRRDTCMVFQDFGLMPWRTVLANVEFPLEIDGRPM